jgi:hypothetical protein
MRVIMKILRRFLLITVFSGWTGAASGMPVIVGFDFDVTGASFGAIQLPSFATVPQVGPYELSLFDDVLLDFTFESLLSPGDLFDFAPGGVDQFRITGINESLMLDPSDPLAFPIGVSFMNITSDPIFNGDPIVENIAMVPVPATFALFGLGLAGLGLTWRKKM